MDLGFAIRNEIELGARTVMIQPKLFSKRQDMTGTRSNACDNLSGLVAAEILDQTGDLRSECAPIRAEAIHALSQQRWDAFFALPELIQLLTCDSHREEAFSCIIQIIENEKIVRAGASLDASFGPLWPRSARYGRKVIAHKTYKRCVEELEVCLRSEDEATRGHAVAIAKEFLRYRLLWYPHPLLNPLVIALCRQGLEAPAACVPDIVRAFSGVRIARRMLLYYMVHPTAVARDREGGSLPNSLCSLLVRGFNPYETGQHDVRASRFYGLLRCLDDTCYRPGTCDRTVPGRLERWFEESFSDEGVPIFPDNAKQALLLCPDRSAELLLRRLQTGNKITSTDVLSVASLPDPTAFFDGLSIGIRMRLGTQFLRIQCSGLATSKRGRQNLAASELVAPTLSILLRPATFAIMEHRIDDGRSTSKWFDQIRAGFGRLDQSERDATEFFITRILLAEGPLALDRTLELLQSEARAVNNRLLRAAERVWRGVPSLRTSPTDDELQAAVFGALLMVFHSERRKRTFLEGIANHWHDARYLFSKRVFREYVRAFLTGPDSGFSTLESDRIQKKVKSRFKRGGLLPVSIDDRSLGDLADETRRRVYAELECPDRDSTDISDTLECESSQRRARRMVRLAVHSLPEKQRKMVELVYFKRMTQEEARHIIGISKSYASRLLGRAMETLRSSAELEALSIDL